MHAGTLFLSFGSAYACRRIATKLMVDVTSMPHLRLPNDLGGACWTASIVKNQVECLLVAWVYSEFYDGPDKIERTALFSALGALAIAWALAFGLFLAVIKRGYLWTFVTLETGHAYLQRCFHEDAGDDEKRMAIFNFNERLWHDFRPAVKDWVRRGYNQWLADNPAWFQGSVAQACVARIPNEFLADLEPATTASGPPVGSAATVTVTVAAETADVARFSE
jgi:hypothetical protein